MTEKELKRLSRAELLELLLLQTRETERLVKRLEKADKMISERYLQVERAGDLAHAVLEVNGVMEAAQEAAKQYLENIARMERETAQRCEKMLAAAREEAQRICQGIATPREPAESGQDLIGEIYALLDEKK